MVKIFLGIPFFGKSRSWKRSQGQVPKNHFFNGEFGILGKFPLRGAGMMNYKHIDRISLLFYNAPGKPQLFTLIWCKIY